MKDDHPVYQVWDLVMILFISWISLSLLLSLVGEG